MTELTTSNPPPCVTSLEEIFRGVILLAVSLTTPGFGMPDTLRFGDTSKRRSASRLSFGAGITKLALASQMVTSAHMIGVMKWAAFFNGNIASRTPASRPILR